MKLIEKAKSVITNKNVQSAFFNLYDRWEDEGRYEDINDYGKALFKAISKNCPNVEAIYVGVTKKPFGVKYNIDGVTFYLFVKVEGEYLTLNCRALEGE